MRLSAFFCAYWLPAAGAVLAGAAAAWLAHRDSAWAVAAAWLLGLAAAGLAAAWSAIFVRLSLRKLQSLAAEDNLPELAARRLSGRVPGLEPLSRALDIVRQRSQSQMLALQQSTARLEAVLEGMQDAVLAVDADDRVLFANRVAVRLLHLPGGGAQGQHILEAIRDHRLARLMLQAREAAQPRRLELSCNVGEDQRDLEVCATPLPGVPCPGVVLVLHDMTELRRLESLRRDFVTNVSHELKTPLSNIKAYAETLASGALEDPTVRSRFVEQIRDQADRLHQLIMDMISLARIESGSHSFDIKPVPLQELLDNCLAHHQETASSRSIELRAEAPAELAAQADPEGLRQMLDNLLDNALKYTSPGGQVQVACRREGQEVVLGVTDTGIGISAEQLPRLFERFYRVDLARARELGGTGLGLSIVKHLAQSFGGSVGVESEVGRGSTFWIRLPVGEEEKRSEGEGEKRRRGEEERGRAATRAPAEG